MSDTKNTKNNSDNKIENEISVNEDEENFNFNDEDEIVFDQDLNDEDKQIAGENLEDFREKVHKSGVVYISYIPEGMTVQFLREKWQPYGVTRIFLAPKSINNTENSKKSHNKKKQIYKEGWAEFSNKLQAKLCEYELNGKEIGGKRNLPFREELWTIKYLHKFKWHHLIEKMNYNRKLREQRLNAEISQAKRETNFIEKKYEQSKIINKKNKKRQRDNDNVELNNDNENLEIINNDNVITDSKNIFKRNFKQRKPIYKK
jgi:ESF2/ABP1 family protein